MELQNSCGFGEWLDNLEAVIDGLRRGEDLYVRSRSTQNWEPVPCKTDSIVFNSRLEYTTMAPALKIGNMSVPAPLSKAPKTGTVYHTPKVTGIKKYVTHVWNDDGFDLECLRRGLVHLSESAATQHTDALIALSTCKPAEQSHQKD